MNRKVLLYTSLLITCFFFIPELQGSEKVFTVVIDPGHGGRDPGAIGVSAKEKNINLAVALKLGRMIADKHADVKVVYTRDKDRFVELDERANIANRNKADLFLSIHTNSVAKGSTVRGTETYTLGLARTDENLAVAMRENAAILLEDDYLQKYEGFDPNSTESYIIFEFMQNKHMEQSVVLASEIQKSFVSTKRVDRGVRQAGFLVLRETSMPSVLVELGYISNRDEERYMNSADGQDKLSAALYNAFSKYKREYDRRQGALSDGGNVAAAAIPHEKPTGENREKSSAPSASNATKQGAVVYKIQILTADKKLSSKSKRFKGYKNVGYYVENGIYKYTYGESTDLASMQKLRRTVAKDFKDAFIISFKDGKRVGN